MQAIIIVLKKKHANKSGNEIMNCTEKKKKSTKFAVLNQCRGNATEFVL